MVKNPMMDETWNIIHCICTDGYKTKNGIKIKTEYPSQPANLITLYPILFEMTEQHLGTLKSKGWGKIEKNFFGKVRYYPQSKNGYCYGKYSLSFEPRFISAFKFLFDI